MNSNQNILNGENKSTANNFKKSELLLIYAVYFLLALYLPVALFTDISVMVLQGLSLVASFLSVFAFWKITKRKQATLSYTLIVVLMFLFIKPVFCGMVAASFATVFILCDTLLKTKKISSKILAFLPSLLAYAVGVVILKDFLLPLTVLFHLPVTVTLAFCLKKEYDRIATVCRTSFAGVFTAVAVIAIALVYNYGFDIGAIREAIHSFKESMIELTANTMFEVYTKAGVKVYFADVKELVEMSVNSMFYLLPGIVIVISNIFSFILHSIMLNIVLTPDSDKEKIMKLATFNMSTVSAVVFLIAFLLSAILNADSGMNVFSLTAANMSVILMPGLVLTAMSAIKMMLIGKRGSCFGFITYFLILMMFLQFPDVIITVASVVGAIIVIANNVIKAKLEKLKK